jgi:hypothetical protein
LLVFCKLWWCSSRSELTKLLEVLDLVRDLLREIGVAVQVETPRFDPGVHVIPPLLADAFTAKDIPRSEAVQDGKARVEVEKFERITSFL